MFLVHSLIKGDRKGAIYGTTFTVLLALVFTCFLPHEFTFFVLSVIVYIVYILFLSGYNIFNIEYPYRPGLVASFTPLNRNLQSLAAKTGKRFYSTESKDSTLPPYWVTGFTDGEGSFSLKILRSSSTRSGYNVTPI